MNARNHAWRTLAAGIPLALLAGCASSVRPDVDAVDPEHYTPEPIPAPPFEIRDDQRLVVIVMPPDASSEGEFAAPKPAMRELKDRLHRTGRFRVLEAETAEEARAIAGRYLGLPAFSDGPMILRWGVTNFRVVQRDRENASRGLGFGGEQSVGMFRAEVKVSGQLTSASTDEILTTAAGEFSHYVSGDWERGEEHKHYYLLFRTSQSDTRAWQGNYGQLMDYAVHDFVRQLVLEVDAQYYNRAPEGGQ